MPDSQSLTAPTIDAAATLNPPRASARVVAPTIDAAATVGLPSMIYRQIVGPPNLPAAPHMWSPTVAATVRLPILDAARLMRRPVVHGGVMLQALVVADTRSEVAGHTVRAIQFGPPQSLTAPTVDAGATVGAPTVSTS